MTMATVQFYNNPYHYPDFKATLTPLTAQVSMTPKNTSTKGGTLHLSGEWGELSTYNYVCIRRNNTTTWAWVDNVRERGSNACEVEYIVDAYRTYKSQLIYGKQFVLRSPKPTNKLDELLGSESPSQNVDTMNTLFSSTMSRVLVVQTSSEPAWVANNTPVQPTPYHFYLIDYNPDNWIATEPIVDLLNKLRNNPQTQNIITMYSIPYMSLSGLSEVSLPLMASDSVADTVEGFRFLSGGSDAKDRLIRKRKITLNQDYRGFLSRRNHSVQVIIPEAGIMNVPDDVLDRGNGSFTVRQDVDLFSGASNYMIETGDSEEFTGISVRGSSISSIPVMSDPYDTYISQNQNALATSLIGDVANVGIGAAMWAANPLIGTSQVASGVSGLVSNATNLLDQRSAIPSNPPAFLGTAMANDFHNRILTIVKYDNVENQNVVNDTFGFPLHMVTDLVVPESGFIQTSNCSISSSGRIPNWAIQDINKRFDSGLRVV